MGWYKQAGIDIDFETGRASRLGAEGRRRCPRSSTVRHGRRAVARGKGIDLVGVMNVYANSPGAVLAQEPGIRDVRDLGKKIGNPVGDGARTMWRRWRGRWASIRIR